MMTHDGRNEGMTHEGDQEAQSIFRALGVRRCETATLQSGSLAPSTSKRTISWFVIQGQCLWIWQCFWEISRGILGQQIQGVEP